MYKKQILAAIKNGKTEELTRLLNQVTSLNLSSNEIGDQGAQHLASALIKNRTLTSLDLGYNEIGAQGAQHLASALIKNSTLTSLSIGSNKIGAQGAQHLASALIKNSTLTSLNLGWNKIGAQGAQHLASALIKNRTLTSLDLGYNEIGAQGAQHLASALIKNSTLTSLNLNNNKIGAQGAQHLASALIKNSTLTSLNLNNNKIGAQGAQHLASALIKNRTLTSLNLRYNKIGAQGAQHLASALIKNSTLTSLDLSNEKIGAQGAQHLASALIKNSTLTSLYLYNNEIGDQGAQHLASALIKNRTLTSLNLRYNKIGAQGAQHLASALIKNSTLTSLNLNNNKIGAQGAQYKRRIEEIIKRNQSLRNQLFVAVKNGNLTLVKKLIEQGVIPYAENAYDNDKDKNNILHLAIQNNQIKVFAWFIKQYLTPSQANFLLNKENKEGETPLDLAKKSRNDEFMRIISSAGNTENVLGTDIKVQRRRRKPKLEPKSKPKPEPKPKLKLKPKPQKKLISGISVSYIISHQDLKYDKKDKLGSGGFGTVYKGTWDFTEVAIKILHIQEMTEDTLKEFKSEAKIMTELHHPNTLPLYGVCIEPGHYAMIMPYMPNKSLYSVLHSNQTMTWSQKWKIAMDVGKGMFHLHKKDILHRDLKSLNVLLDGQMKAVVCDFGISRVKQETRTTTASMKTAQSVGTVHWMAPELFKRRAKFTKACDVYSFGMVLWEIATREKPWSDAQNVGIIMQWVSQGEREDIPDDPKKCPPSFAKLIADCWKKRGEDRPTMQMAVKTLHENYNEALAMK